MEPCLRRLMTSTVKVRTVTAYTEQGDETLGPVRAIRAYVERKIINDGEERKTRTVVVTEDEVTPDDRVWLEGYDTSNPIFSKRPSDVVMFKHPVTGVVDHYEVML